MRGLTLVLIATVASAPGCQLIAPFPPLATDGGDGDGDSDGDMDSDVDSDGDADGDVDSDGDMDSDVDSGGDADGDVDSDGDMDDEQDGDAEAECGEPGASCDDGRWCNGEDTCDDEGNCVSEGDPCTEGCLRCNEEEDRCDLAADWCYIWSTCYANEALNPENPCQWCDWVADQRGWTDRPPGSSCDDGLWCNGDDSCDGFGECLHEGDPCTESCRTCNDEDDRCDVDEGSCFIDGVCYEDEDLNPENHCQACDSIASIDDWTVRPDFSRCDLMTDPDRAYDICIHGECVSPGCGDPSCNTRGPNWTLPDTNQRTCYGDGEELAPCPGTADSPECGSTDYCGQDAQYGWDTEHAADERFTRTGGAEPVVTDNVTGLVWQGCAAGLTGSTCESGSAGGYDWSEALEHCDTLSWGGNGDWRLPDRYELQSIVDYGRRDPAIDPTAFPATPSRRWFWSSSSYAYAGDSSYAWLVHFNSGLVSHDDKTYSHYVRCVRGGP